MKYFRKTTKIITFVIILFLTGCADKPLSIIYISHDANSTEELAAREIRKYVYLRTGELLDVRTWNESIKIKGNSILVGRIQSGLMKSMAYSFPDLGHDDFILKSIHSSSGKKLLVCGGSNISTLYAAYHLAEQLGVGFYLDGDSLWVGQLFPGNITEVARIIVPSPQTIIEKGNDYKVKVICFNVNPKKAVIYWRSLGEKNFTQTELKKISATYWIATIPSESIPDDFEYYIKIQDNKDYIYPASSPQINQTVVLLKNQR
jgi:hypothetical protein